ncbi:uncharacterized protein LOC110704543 [Chenopodium quinoa]|uniref:uncharacterized protein LOC110704543 n=1 Tax=Chenopodium quinoa TaxID=63459 RepID=UPI000B7828B7|nr:uncharacterized protein LOC110704543 [Chenopodium quinoa]
MQIKMTKSPKKNVAKKPPTQPDAAKKPQKEDPAGKKAPTTQKISPKKPTNSKKSPIKGICRFMTISELIEPLQSIRIETYFMIVYLKPKTELKKFSLVNKGSIREEKGPHYCYGLTDQAL